MDKPSVLWATLHSQCKLHFLTLDSANLTGRNFNYPLRKACFAFDFIFSTYFQPFSPVFLYIFFFCWPFFTGWKISYLFWILSRSDSKFCVRTRMWQIFQMHLGPRNELNSYRLQREYRAQSSICKIKLKTNCTSTIHKININGKEIKSIGSQMLYSMGERK